MKEFVLLFRMDLHETPKPTQMNVYMRQWMSWVNDISNKGQLASGGNHLSNEGRVIRGRTLDKQPHRVNKESVTGYLLVLAHDIDGATKIAQACPILQGEGTSVEVRETATSG